MYSCVFSLAQILCTFEGRAKIQDFDQDLEKTTFKTSRLFRFLTKLLENLSEASFKE